MKRFLFLILATILCLGLLCACGEATNEGNNDDSSTTEEKDKGSSQASANANELLSGVFYTYKNVQGENIREEEMQIELEWTENGAVLEGYEESESGRSEVRMELLLDDKKIPVSITKTVKDTDGETEVSTVNFSYPKERQIKATTVYSDGDEYSTIYDFDKDGRVTRKESDSYVYSYEYDSHGNRVLDRIEYKNEERDDRVNTTKYTYDKSGKITFAVQTNSSTGEETQTHYYYYPNGSVMYILSLDSQGDVNDNFYPYNSKDFSWSRGMSDSLGEGVEYTTEKDSNGYITKIIRTNTHSGETKYLTFEYDNKGNLVKKVDFDGRTTNWAYDSQNRPIKYTRDTAEHPGEIYYTIEYEYDSQGRLVSEKRYYSDGDSHTQRWAYNEAGMVDKRTESSVYKDNNRTVERSMSIEYVENSKCSINSEWASFFLENFLNVAMY